MNVQKLTVVLEALRCGSMSKAAEELGYTQSGLSYTINSLESELGFPIVNRDSSGIRLSAEGQELLPHIEELVACEKRFTDYAHEMLHRRGNVLNVASYPSVSFSLLPRILADFNRSCPDARVNIRVGSRDEIISWLAEGSVDFGFSGQIRLPGCDWLPLLEDPELAILPADFPTDGLTAFPMGEFQKHPFVMPVFWAEEAELAQLLEEYRIAPQFVVEQAGDNAPILAMVSQGIALSAIPELTILPTRELPFKTLPIDPPCKRVLGVNYRPQSDTQTAAGQFLRCLRRWKKKHCAL